MNSDDLARGRADVFFGDLAVEYHDRYLLEDFDLTKAYPGNRIRFDIFQRLLDRQPPTAIMDAGCGSATPMLQLLNAGFDVHGFDPSEKMVAEGQVTLDKGGYEPDRVFRADLAQIETIPAEHLSRYDCLTAMGVLSYIRDETSALATVRQLLRPDGRFIFSLRNELLSLFSQNHYTSRLMLDKLVPVERLPNDLRERFEADLVDKYPKPASPSDETLKKIDDQGVWSRYHNPLEIPRWLSVNGFEVLGIYYYHFHPLPPIYERLDPILFREIALEMEDPTDWRGMFLSSAFVVDAVRVDGGPHDE